jgi:hypothetical protein
LVTVAAGRTVDAVEGCFTDAGGDGLDTVLVEVAGFTGVEVGLAGRTGAGFAVVVEVDGVVVVSGYVVIGVVVASGYVVTTVPDG